MLFTGVVVSGFGSGAAVVVDAGSLPMKPSDASEVAGGAACWVVGLSFVSAGAVVVGEGAACWVVCCVVGAG